MYNIGSFYTYPEMIPPKITWIYKKQSAVVICLVKLFLSTQASSFTSHQWCFLLAHPKLNYCWGGLRRSNGALLTLRVNPKEHFSLTHTNNSVIGNRGFMSTPQTVIEMSVLWLLILCLSPSLSVTWICSNLKWLWLMLSSIQCPWRTKHQ